MNNTAVILAAGSGTRMKTDKNKLLFDIGGMTVLERTVKAFCSCKIINEVIVAAKEDDIPLYEEVLSSYDITYAIGGKTRQQSVTEAVSTIDDCDFIVIHDGARPLVSQKEITDVILKAVETGAAAIGVPVKDTIKVVNKNSVITDTPDRSSLVAIRTPQVFSFSEYKKALHAANEAGNDFTDDCRLLEAAGKEVSVVVGEYSNIKITTPEDIPIARAILDSRCNL